MNFEELAAASELVYGPVGRWFIEKEELLSQRFFDGKFPPHPVRLAPVAPHGKCLGLSGNTSMLGYWNRNQEDEGEDARLGDGLWLYLHPKWFNVGGDERLSSADLIRAEQVLLHEMLHVWLHILCAPAGHDSYGWAAGVERIYRLMGFDVVVGEVADRNVCYRDPETGLFNVGPDRGLIRAPVDDRDSLTYHATTYFPRALLGEDRAPLDRRGTEAELPPEDCVERTFVRYRDRDLGEIECPYCATVFVPASVKTVYCSGQCRVAAHRERRKAQAALDA